MRSRDLLQLTFSSVRAARGRSRLTALGIAIGIAAVVLLTAVGEGIHRFVVAEFTQFGTHIVAINPGKAQTHGASIGIFGSPRPLTLDDALAMERLPGVRAVVPALWGNAEVRGNGRKRRTMVYGVGPEFPEAFRFEVAAGRFLEDGDPHAARAQAVLGSRLKRELFGNLSPLGAQVRVAGHRFRVIGVMRPKGTMLGFDLDDTLYLPTARALELFNRNGVMEIDVLYQPGTDEDELVAGIRRLISARHGRDDVTITTQKQMLEVLGSVLDVLTLAVAGLGGISLAVGSVGILTIMTIAVSERTAEVGLLRALGSTRRDILLLFLGESALLATLGGLLGLALGLGGALLLGQLLPSLPVHPAWPYVFAALAGSTLIGLAAGILPARRAARLDPIEALRSE